MSSVKLPFSDRWMFNRVMCQERICRRVIEAAFNIEVERIDYLNAEQSYEPSADNRGVRMDVVAKSSGRVFDLEMQVVRERFLGKRMRYYQSALDASALGRGEHHRHLPESFILFVCLSDPFDLGLPVYELERRCAQASDLFIGDESHWVALNAQAWADARTQELGDLLHYVESGAATGPLSREIEGLVATYTEDRKWVGRVTTLEQEMAWQREDCLEQGRAEGRAEGRSEGRAEGEDRLAALVGALLGAGRADDLERIAEDRAYREALLREFGL